MDQLRIHERRWQPCVQNPQEAKARLLWRLGPGRSELQDPPGSGDTDPPGMAGQPAGSVVQYLSAVPGHDVNGNHRLGQRLRQSREVGTVRAGVVIGT